MGRGFQVDWAEDGRIAELRIAAEDFDVILLDLGLPSLSGADLLADRASRGQHIGLATQRLPGDRHG